MHPAAPATKRIADNRLIFRFLLVAGAMYLVWFFGYEQWLAIDTRFDTALCDQIARTAVHLLKYVGFPAAMHPNLPAVINLNGQAAVIVGIPCNGLVLYALFAGFVLAYPGPWKRKAWFIPLGMALIWVLNVARVAALAINQYYAHQSVDFNHHYTFTFIVYGFIFGLWMLWARRLSMTTSAPNVAVDNAPIAGA